jgi:hypothetical protein
MISESPVVGIRYKQLDGINMYLKQRHDKIKAAVIEGSGYSDVSLLSHNGGHCKYVVYIICCVVFIIVQCIYLFICGLFTDTVSSSDYIASNDTMINNDLERMCKEVVVV